MTVTKKMEAYLEAYGKRWPLSGSILAAKDGKVLFRKGYGYANIEHQVPNSPKTSFHVGSISKMFTAMGIAILHEDGLLNIDDPINKHLSDYYQFDSAITIRHLLNHTSGIFCYCKLYEFLTMLSRQNLSHKEIIGLFCDRPLNFKPGTDYSYCSSGYYLLGVIAEKVSDMPLSDLLGEKIFKPSGMLNTLLDNGMSIIPNMAYGYTRNHRDTVRNAIYDLSFSVKNPKYLSGPNQFNWIRKFTGNIWEYMKETALRPK
ncbi:MAG: beta-lactamase family protein [Spirochaetales bacterium]|nr:beta-lactamase family protein [Spirochaetales bacterium]